MGEVLVRRVVEKIVLNSIKQNHVFHQYLDMETFLPDEKYEDDFKIQALNLRGIVHSDRSRDMVLNR